MSIPEQWFLPAHFILEMLAIFFSWIIFLLGWNAYTPNRPRNIIFLSCSLLSVGVLDLFRMMPYDGMPPLITANTPHKAIVFSLAAHMVAIFALGLVVFFPWKRFRYRSSRYLCLLASLCLCVGLIALILYRASWIPVTITEGNGLTPFKIGIEVAFAAILLLIMIGLLTKTGSRRIEGIHKGSLVTAIGCMILGQSCFIFYDQTTDAMNVVGHLLKVISFYYIYRSILKDSIHIPYARLVKLEKELIRSSETFSATIHSMEEARTEQMRLEEIQARKNSILEETSDFISIANSQGELLYCNETARNILGLESPLPPHRTIDQAFPQWAFEQVVNVGLPAAIRDGLWHGETALLDKAGKQLPVSQTIVAHKNGEGQVEYFSTICRDITERKQIEQRDKLSARLFECAREGFMVTDAKHAILQVNPACVAITGYGESEVLGNTPRMLSSGWHKSDFYDGMRHSIHETGHWSGQMWNKHKNGDYYLIEITISKVSDQSFEYYIAVFKDITEKQQLEAKLTHQASHDILTGLPNRETLAIRFEQAVQYVENQSLVICLMHLDIDNLKQVNAEFGHSVGDQLLIMIAERLKQSARASSTVARISGDEFVILLPDLRRQEDYIRVVDRTRETLSPPFEVASQRISITFSIRTCFYPDHGVTLDALIMNANPAIRPSTRTLKGQ